MQALPHGSHVVLCRLPGGGPQLHNTLTEEGVSVQDDVELGLFVTAWSEPCMGQVPTVSGCCLRPGSERRTGVGGRHSRQGQDHPIQHGEAEQGHVHECSGQGQQWPGGPWAK